MAVQSVKGFHFGELSSVISVGEIEKRDEELDEDLDDSPPCALVLVIARFHCAQQRTSFFLVGSQQGKREQETAAYIGSSFPGIVEYLFIYPLSYSRKGFRQGDLL